MLCETRHTGVCVCVCAGKAMELDSAGDRQASGPSGSLRLY